MERTRGFRKHFEVEGFPIPDDYVLHSPFDTQGGDVAGAELLARLPCPTAIFAVNDSAAIGGMGALREHGLRPGADVAVIGYNDISVAGDMPVPLTTVRSSMFDMGTTAMGLLPDRVEGRTVRSKRLSPATDRASLDRA
ncbi:substrate-binding domain-containing protein [Sciscionella marina]|uniref:substrate-binding domain-containing protein n=1 Tax=Sciscionella marina TaxID=508770 RepID=UPI00036EE8B8|nr:substrate-binding domain-containing protein [Sciscionella marina]